MTTVFALIFLFALILLPVLLIKPNILIRLFKVQWSRKRILGVLSTIIVLSFIAIAITVPPSNNTTSTKDATSSNSNTSQNSSIKSTVKTSSIQTTTQVQTTTPKPTTTNTPATTSVSLSLSITKSAGTLNAGNYATESISTTQGAYCTIEVDYKSGASTAQGLEPQTATSGSISWTWKVGTRTTAGSWPINISCSLNGRPKSIQDSIKVN